MPKKDCYASSLPPNKINAKRLGSRTKQRCWVNVLRLQCIPCVNECSAVFLFSAPTPTEVNEASSSRAFCKFNKFPLNKLFSALIFNVHKMLIVFFNTIQKQKLDFHADCMSEKKETVMTLQLHIILHHVHQCCSSLFTKLKALQCKKLKTYHPIIPVHEMKPPNFTSQLQTHSSYTPLHISATDRMRRKGSG